MRRHVSMLFALVACMGLAACGDDDDGGGDGGTTAAADSAAALTFVLSGSGRATDLTVEGEPAAGLTEITFRNETRGDHEAQLVRVEGQQSEAAVLRQFGQTGEGAAAQARREPVKRSRPRRCSSRARITRSTRPAAEDRRL